MIAYFAMLDISLELVQQLARLLRAERRRRGTRTGARALTCWQQAVLGLRWFRQNAEDTALDAESSRHPGYRYLDDVIAVLAEQAPDLHQALRRAGVGHEVNVAVSESFGDQVDQIAGQVRLRAAVPDGHRGQDGTATDATGTAVSRRS